VRCGDTITHNTKLTNDLRNCPTNGIVIGADNITLDFNGFPASLYYVSPTQINFQAP